MHSRLTNLTSGSSLTQITGSNSLILKLSTEISGGTYQLIFTGSQHKIGSYFVTGVYSASVNIPSTNSILNAKLQQSGSVKFTPIWGSLDNTVSYITGSAIYARPPQRGAMSLGPRKLVITIVGLKESYGTDESPMLRVHIFDHTSPLIMASRLPVELPGIVIRDVHYQIRDAITGETIIPFDTVKNSTRVSSDSSGMYFTLKTSNLTNNRSYVIDILTTGSETQTHKNVSNSFNVSDLR